MSCRHWDSGGGDVMAVENPDIDGLLLLLVFEKATEADLLEVDVFGCKFPIPMFWKLATRVCEPYEKR